MNINTKTKVCMIIGDPVEHSISPKMHNYCYKALAIDDKFVFLAARVTKDELQKAVDGARALNFRGLTITVPHKIEVIPYLDEIDLVAQKIGAVNTVVNDGGKLIGFNTDWRGIIDPLKKTGPLKGKRVAVVGAGGAARAAVYGLVTEGAEVTIYNRTIEKANELAKEFNCAFGSLNEISKADIYINATKLGLEESDPFPIPFEKVGNEAIVFDVVYKEKETTKFIQELQKKGVRAFSGLDMLLYQGLEQFRLYTGVAVDEETMRKAIYED